MRKGKREITCDINSRLNNPKVPVGAQVELLGLFISCAISSKQDKRWAINALKKAIKRLEKMEVSNGTNDQRRN